MDYEFGDSFFGSHFDGSFFLVSGDGAVAVKVSEEYYDLLEPHPANVGRVASSAITSASLLLAEWRPFHEMPERFSAAVREKLGRLGCVAFSWPGGILPAIVATSRGTGVAFPLSEAHERA